MYVEIHAKSDSESSRGKTAWLNTGNLRATIAIKRSNGEHLGSPEWYLQLNAKGYREVGTGDRGGDVRGTDYRLEIQLTPSEVAHIVDFALHNSLVSAVAAPSVPQSQTGG